MKIVHFILALYILCLAVYPCSDSNTCLDEKKQGIVSITTDHPHTTEEQDICSPFCICACCSSQVRTTGLQNILLTNRIHSTPLNTHYVQKISLENHQSIFQPPRS